MKKTVCILICLLMVFALVSCDDMVRVINLDDMGFDASNNQKNELNSDATQSDGKGEKQPSSDDKKDENDKSNQSNNNGGNGNNSSSVGDVDNGVLKEASCEIMSIPANMELLGTTENIIENGSTKIKAKAVMYSLDGVIVNWATENDLVYVITKGNNRLVAIDSNSMCPIYNAPLAGVPAEMNIINNKIYISFPDLCRIDVFSKFDGVKQSSLYFAHAVSSFCLDGDYIYYSEHDQHCRVFKKNLVTEQITMIQSDNCSSFYFPKLYLNKQDGILYIGECRSSGSAIYYFDANTLALKSVFKKDDYGIMNHTREIFHVGDQIFWGNYCLSDTNAKQLIGRYGTADYGSMVYASEDLVSTYDGIFLTDTFECIIDYDKTSFDYEYLLISESYNIFFRQRSYDAKVIIGINFEIQDILKTN